MTFILQKTTGISIILLLMISHHTAALTREEIKRAATPGEDTGDLKLVWTIEDECKRYNLCPGDRH